nr:sugar phosphate isomerase/epimerase [bacterium]
MKRGIVQNCIACGAGAQQQFALAAAAGFEAIEIHTQDCPHKRDDLRRLAGQYGLAITSVMNQNHGDYPITSPDAAVVAEGIRGMKLSIDTACETGCDTVLFVPGFVREDAPYEAALERSMANLPPILEYADKRGVTVAVENIWNKFLVSPIEFRQYIDFFATPRLKAYFDVGNIVAYGIPEQWIDTLGRRICRVHVKGYHQRTRQFCGLQQGTINWPRVMSALRCAGYDGFVTVEIDAQSPQALAGMNADLSAILAM